MQTILLTGSNGQVGQAVLKHLDLHPAQELILTTRQASKTGPNVRYFDFEHLPKSFTALEGVDILFLLRPPQIADISKYFEPLINAAKEKQVKHILFLSVQGADKIALLPHAKIEKLICESGIDYTFFRPSYFMQNLITQLKEDIKLERKIILPAGKTPFLWVDVNDIGKAIAAVIKEVNLHQNKAYTLTGKEYYNFYEVSRFFESLCGYSVHYQAVFPLYFLYLHWRKGASLGFTFVKIALHYLARFQEKPKVSQDMENLTGQVPNALPDFIKAHCSEWLNNSQMASDN